MSAKSAYRATPSLSIYPVPPAGGLMVLLRAYFDDSKDENVFTMGGYLSDLASWGNFDRVWDATLTEFEVPYLHMKEFWDTDGIYRHIKADQKKEQAFFATLAQVIKDHVKFCTQTTVLLDDLKRFNRKHHLSLSAPGLAIYGCLMGLQTQFRGRSIEVVFDKLERAHSLIQLGIDYAESDDLEPLNKKLIRATHVPEDETWREILPLQAADFVAWEMRKICIDLIPWMSNLRFEHVRSGTALSSLNDWLKRFMSESGRQPRDRKSFKALRQGRARPEGYIFNYAALERLKDRHPYGWRLTEKRRLALFSEGRGA